MPIWGSPVGVDLTVDATLTGATLTGAAFGFAWLAVGDITAGDINVVFAACAFNGTQPIESNSHGKF